MFKKIGTTIMAIALSTGALALSSGEARAASDYCREYTRTVYIGGQTQDAYGTACLQSDGSWMIVGEGLGNDIPANTANVNYVIHDQYRDVVPQQVVYYDRSPVIYRTRPAPLFVWYSNGNYYRNGHYASYRNPGWNNRNNHRDWDHDDNRRDNNHGRGRH